MAVFGAFTGEVFLATWDKYPTYLTPDSLTVGIAWLVIYTWQGVLVLVQCVGAENVNRGAEAVIVQRDMLFGLDVRWRLVIAFGLNAFWMPLYITAHFTVAFIFLVPHLFILISIYSDMTLRKTTFGIWITVSAPISMHISLVVVTMCINAFTFVGEMGWKDMYGVGGTVTAAVVVLIFVQGLSVVWAVAFADVVYPFVTGWVFFGIFKVHSMAGVFPDAARSSTILDVALIGDIVNLCGFVAAAGLACYRCRLPPKPEPWVYMQHP